MSCGYPVPMGRGVGFLLLLIVVAVGGYLYTRQLESVSPNGTAPSVMVDVVGVRNDLTAMAHAQQRYWATNSRYASLDELRSNGDIHIPTRLFYAYSATATDSGFEIIATYSGSDPKAPKRITVDETMKVTTD
jgi:hypothetical protein